MPAPVRPQGETRQLILDFLERSRRAWTWPEIARAVGITAGYRTQARMLESRQIQKAGFDASGKPLYAAGSLSITQPVSVKQQTSPSPSGSSTSTTDPPKAVRIAPTTHSEDYRAGMLGESAVIEQRRLELTKPHVEPLQRYVEEMRNRIPRDRFVPNFDPWDGGIDATCLLLLEAPGRWAKASGFASRDNNSQTSKNLFTYSQIAGIDRRKTLMWNVVPWYIGTQNTIRQANSSDLREGVGHLLELIALLPKLKLVVFFGGKAQTAQGPLAGARPSLQFLAAMHPSNVALNQKPENRSIFLQTLMDVARILALQERMAN